MLKHSCARILFGWCLFSLLPASFANVALAEKGQEELEAKVEKLIEDVSEWQADLQTAKDFRYELALERAVGVAIDCLATQHRLDLAEEVGDQLERKLAFYSSALPVVLKQGDFEAAREYADRLGEDNPSILRFLYRDIFVAYSKRHGVEKGMEYRASLPSEYNDVSLQHAALAQLTQHYRNINDSDNAELAIQQIRSDRYRIIAKAIQSSSDPLEQSISIASVEPLYLRLIHRKESQRQTYRRDQPWFSERVNYLKVAGEVTATEHRRRFEALPKIPVVDDDLISGHGLEALILAAVADEESLEALLEQLRDKYCNENFSRLDPVERNWIVYVFSRTGHWQLSDVKHHWNRWSPDEAADWIVSFAAGFHEAGNKRKLAKLIKITDTIQPRCFLRIGDLVGETSAALAFQRQKQAASREPSSTAQRAVANR